METIESNLEVTQGGSKRTQSQDEILDLKMLKRYYQKITKLVKHESSSTHKEHFIKCNHCKKDFKKDEDHKCESKSNETNNFKVKIEHLKCEKCDKVFQKYKSLWNHNNLLHKENTCNICLKIFNGTKILKAHVKECHEERKNQCELCSQSFAKACYLRDHINSIHRGLKMFQCDVCNEQFTRRNGLKRHNEAKHTKIKNFQCSLCDAAFGRNHLLKDHIRVLHDGIKEKCKYCDETFSHKSDLSRHNSKVHSDSKQIFDCKICGQVFFNYGAFYQHKRSKHKPMK